MDLMSIDLTLKIGKGGKVGAVANVAKGMTFKKAGTVAGKVASNKLTTSQGLKG